jgi:hypothetical protein
MGFFFNWWLLLLHCCHVTTCAWRRRRLPESNHFCHCTVSKMSFLCHCREILKKCPSHAARSFLTFFRLTETWHLWQKSDIFIESNWRRGFNNNFWPERIRRRRISWKSMWTYLSLDCYRIIYWKLPLWLWKQELLKIKTILSHNFCIRVCPGTK